MGPVNSVFCPPHSKFMWSYCSHAGKKKSENENVGLETRIQTHTKTLKLNLTVLFSVFIASFFLRECFNDYNNSLLLINF